MNKQEYIANLKIQLKDEKYETVCQVIEYYEEIIDDCIEEGKNENEVINSLENVQDVVRNIKDDVLSFDINPIKKNSISYFIIILLILGFPLWGSLLAAVFLLILSIYIMIWCIPIVTCSLTLSSFIIFSVGIFGSFPLFMSSLSLGLTQLGVAALFAGIGIISFILTYISYQKILGVSIYITRQLKTYLLNILRKVRVVC